MIFFVSVIIKVVFFVLVFVGKIIIGDLSI